MSSKLKAESGAVGISVLSYQPAVRKLSFRIVHPSLRISPRSPLRPHPLPWPRASTAQVAQLRGLRGGAFRVAGEDGALGGKIRPGVSLVAHSSLLTRLPGRTPVIGGARSSPARSVRGRRLRWSVFEIPREIRNGDSSLNRSRPSRRAAPTWPGLCPLRPVGDKEGHRPGAGNRQPRGEAGAPGPRSPARRSQPSSAACVVTTRFWPLAKLDGPDFAYATGDCSLSLSFCLYLKMCT